MPLYANTLALMTLPMQATFAFWSSYYRALSAGMAGAMPPGAGEAVEAAAAGTAALSKGTRTTASGGSLPE